MDRVGCLDFLILLLPLPNTSAICLQVNGKIYEVGGVSDVH